MYEALFGLRLCSDTIAMSHFTRSSKLDELSDGNIMPLTF